ncbi:hypothetical protein [Pseudooceanicola sp. HF7]|uniref:hypothetical protein n=1 Tax=Pseudooceanicola sp. HF7 TaxID=2721560 RepID=UPI0014313E01|nr:hypothetical protein [Pseudooceanicola sp. HF7]NIZ09887.1 hypothetical protein [Pseudooceanicola sp. HF7]
MQWSAITRYWSAYVPAVMQRWPETSEEDLLSLDGSEDALTGYLIKLTGRPAEDIRDEIAEWRTGATPADIRMDEAEDMRNIEASGRYLPEGEDVYDDDRSFGDDAPADPPVGRSG